MSQENVEIVRRGYDHFNRTGEPDSACLIRMSSWIPPVPPSFAPCSEATTGFVSGWRLNVTCGRANGWNRRS
jgi:hypothetical protein